MPRSFQRSTIPVLALLAALLCGVLFGMRGGARALRGDEGTYVAMAASLARDLDLRFAAPDRAWAEGRAAGAVTVILERTGRGVAYSKPVLYPLLAAPFVALAGDWGLWFVNLLALLAALALARGFLARAESGAAAPGEQRATARETVLTFAATSIVLPYVAWRMTETLQVALALTGLVLTFAALGARRPGGPARGGPGTPPASPSGRVERLLAHPASDLAGGALLGLLVSLREPNAVVAAVPVLGALLGRDLRRAARIAAAVALAYVAVLGLTWALTGAMNPYKALRSTFDARTGYPEGADGAAALARFDNPEVLATSSLELEPVVDGRRTAYAALYFFVGRHTGLAIFFPAALCFAASSLRRPNRRALAALAGFFGLALFYLVWLPVNYFGGETFLGNRYILAAYPCLLVALPRLPSRRLLLAIWALAGVVGVSAFASEWRSGALDATSQSHANAGLFRLLPYESTASNLDGRRDRYWAEDFVRFVDPFAAAEASSFVVRSDQPAAEVEIATRFGAAPMHLIVVADIASATLVISDWRGASRYPLGPIAIGRSGGQILHRPAPAWRRHRFWWSPVESYDVRLVRFAVETADARPASLRIRYLGRNAPRTSGFARANDPVALPAEAIAGSHTRIALRIRNTGDWPWSPTAVTPVQLGARIVPLGANHGEAVEPRFALPRTIAPGEMLATDVTLDWPAVPGRYRVSLDLVLEDVAWFGDQLGAPLASAEVEIREP